MAKCIVYKLPVDLIQRAVLGLVCELDPENLRGFPTCDIGIELVGDVANGGNLVSFEVSVWPQGERMPEERIGTLTETKEFLQKLLRFGADQLAWEIKGIVSAGEVTGSRQESEEFGHEYIDQRKGVGDDDYSGFAYLPLDAEHREYVKIYFSC